MNSEREKFPLTREMIEDLEDPKLYETVHEDESAYKHSMTNYFFISKRLSDGKFFRWGYTADYNEGLCDWSLDEVEEVFPTTKVVQVFE